jgi:hypothetical protein
MADEFGNDPPDLDPDEVRSILPKSLHKALVTGVSAVLMTEEGIRNALGDMRLPKEAISYVIQQTERSRKDLFQSVTGEIKKFLDTADIPGALRKALTGLKVEVRADIRFVDDDHVETDVRTRTHAADQDDDSHASDDGEADDDNEHDHAHDSVDDAPRPKKRRRKKTQRKS